MVTFLRDAFRRSLKKYPVLTNTTVYATFYTAAELSQQTVIRYNSPEDKKPEYNYVGAARIAGVGSCIYAPTLYYWYRLLDRKFVGTATKTVLTKVCADQFIMTPILLAGFFTVMAIMERKADIFEELREKYVKAFIANQTFWIPAQTLNFYMVPPNLRVVYVGSVSFIWINCLCYIKRQSLQSEKKEMVK